MVQADITLQTEQVSGRFYCEGFAGIPVDQPCWIVLSCCSNPALQTQLQTLRQELIWQILSLAPESRKVAPIQGCPRLIDSPTRSCQLPRYSPQARKILVLVGDDQYPILETNLALDWLGGTPHYRILPVYPTAVSALPPALGHLQIAHWHNTISEIVPAILAASEIAPEEFRIFISYKRSEAPDLAEQLFEALSKERFDVFLDRFSIPPVLNFKTRLRPELADKAKLLAVESSSAWQSSWIRYEVAYARKHRLGRLALALPNSKPIGGSHSSRMLVDEQDLEDEGRILSVLKLAEVVQRVRQEHQLAILQRRYFLRQSLLLALRFAGAGTPAFTTGGIIKTSSTSQPVIKKYNLSLTVRPAELRDFHSASIMHDPNETSLLVGPADTLEVARRGPLEWLSAEVDIGFHDEGRMLELANGIAKGAL